MNEQQGQVGPLPKRVSHVVGHTLPVIKALVLVVSIAAAVPTARNLYYSWVHDIPFSEVDHRLTQYNLWLRNLECKIDYRALLTANGHKVDVGACPKTGDIAIKITADKGVAAYEWIAFDQLKKPAPQTAGLRGVLVGSAIAATAPLAGISQGAPLWHKVQAGMEVVCEKRDRDKVIRIVKEAGKCFREIWLPMRGSLAKREEVSCDTRC